MLAPRPIRIHAETAWRMMTRRDPWVNLLRQTVAVFSAGVGGADSISAVCRSIINQTVAPEELRGRMSAIFMLVVTSGPRLGDLESGIAASLTTAGAAVVSGGLACVAGIGLIVVLFPALVAYDGRRTVVT